VASESTGTAKSANGAYPSTVNAPTVRATAQEKAGTPTMTAINRRNPASSHGSDALLSSRGSDDIG
jgi:hypothetical protein